MIDQIVRSFRFRQFIGSRRLPATVAAMAVTLLLAGCGRNDGPSQAHESDATEHLQESAIGVSFNTKKGLFISPETATIIGLRVADVAERKIESTLQFSAQIYRAATEAVFESPQSNGPPVALASGNVSPVELAKLGDGQGVSVRSGENEVAMPGRIVALKRDLEKVSGQGEVLLAISDPPQPLATGAFVSVNVPLGGGKSVVSVPRSAVFRTTEGDFVYTVSGDHFMRAAIKLGVVNHDFAEVTDGLYAGDQIVVHPVMTLWLAELQSLRGGKACADGH